MSSLEISASDEMKMTKEEYTEDNMDLFKNWNIRT
jgi:hypothetical protein